MSSKNKLAALQSLIESKLALALPNKKEYDEVILEAMNYSLLAGGKRLRPVLMMASCEAVGGNINDTLDVAAAIECVHTYSLIHDDLPGMDDDELRRGKPTNHVVFGEGMAILAGDGLLTEAFTLISRNMAAKGEWELGLKLVFELSEAAGVLGMVGGQARDLLAEERQIDSAEMTYIHTHKTGALIKAAVRMGALIGKASEAELAALSDYATEIGLAFQITDDILDIEGDAALLGKAVGSDERKEKSTYPSLYGLEESKKLAAEAISKAKKSLESLSGDTEVLSFLADYILSRNK